MAGMNNVSKRIFSDFVKSRGLMRDEGARQVMFDGKEKLSFSVSTRETVLECRQTYEDCDGFVTYHVPTNTFYKIMVPNIPEYCYSRTMKNGTRAYSVKVDIGAGIKI